MDALWVPVWGAFLWGLGAGVVVGTFRAVLKRL